MFTVLAGGIGAARFLRGLVEVVDPGDITVIGNVGDDLVLHGLHVSPDLDTVTYTLAGAVHREQGWGRSDESFHVAEELARYSDERWFSLGDRDLATHIHRTRRLREGLPLSAVTAEIAAAWGLRTRLLPATDEPVATRVATRDGRDLHFQEYWVRDRARPAVASVRLEGSERALPAPGVLEAIADAEGVLVCPSNPVVSIGTILAVPGILDAVTSTRAPVVGVSPIIGGEVVRGMADRLLPAVGAEVSAVGVAGLYRDWLDGWVMDQRDAPLADEAAALGPVVTTTETLMSSVGVAAELARTTVELARELRA